MQEALSPNFSSNIACAKVPDMARTYRVLLAVLLMLLLPLHSGAALARSAGMAARHLVNGSVSTPLSAQHQTGHAATHAHRHHAALPQTEPASSHHEPAATAHGAFTSGMQVHMASIAVADNTSQHSHAAPGDCPNCAKCCLAGAAAPPPVIEPAIVMPVGGVLPSSVAADVNGFIPDGPERPPRLFS